jgi:diaminopimelate epimerase
LYESKLEERSVTRKLIVEFTKMNGAGNDFIVLDNRFYAFSDEELSELARALSPRRTAIGADGLLALAPAESTDHHYRMRYFNADGSLGTMCGNGARCLAAFARRAGIHGDPLVFESDAGLYEAVTFEDGRVAITAQPPRDWKPNVRLDGGDGERVHYLWTGTEHAVVFVENLDQADVPGRGAAIRHDPALKPRGANVNFVQVSGPNQLRVRTFEKGVESETLACGTGAIASAVASVLTGGVKGPMVSVDMPGGSLEVYLEKEDDEIQRVRLSGPAETTFRGTFEWS